MPHNNVPLSKTLAYALLIKNGNNHDALINKILVKTRMIVYIIAKLIAER